MNLDNDGLQRLTVADWSTASRLGIANSKVSSASATPSPCPQIWKAAAAAAALDVPVFGAAVN